MTCSWIWDWSRNNAECVDATDGRATWAAISLFVIFKWEEDIRLKSLVAHGICIQRHRSNRKEWCAWVNELCIQMSLVVMRHMCVHHHSPFTIHCASSTIKFSASEYEFSGAINGNEYLIWFCCSVAHRLWRFGGRPTTAPESVEQTWFGIVGRTCDGRTGCSARAWRGSCVAHSGGGITTTTASCTESRSTRCTGSHERCEYCLSLRWMKSIRNKCFHLLMFYVCFVCSASKVWPNRTRRWPLNCAICCRHTIWKVCCRRTIALR